MKMKEVVEFVTLASQSRTHVVAFIKRLAETHELRRKGTPRSHELSRDENGHPVRDHYLPHIPIDAQIYARTWKALKSLAEITGTDNGTAWTKFGLANLEDYVRQLKMAANRGIIRVHNHKKAKGGIRHG